MSVKLTDAQLVMMGAALQRKDRCLSAPATIRGALSKVTAKLTKLGLVREIEAKPGAPIWRRDDAGQGYAFKLTAAGLKAIAVDERSPDAIEPGEAPQSQAKNGASPDEGGHAARVAAPRDGSKLALVIEVLRRADGATIIDLTQATGWLPHTTRAALTGLRKRGYAVIRNGSALEIQPTGSRTPLLTGEIVPYGSATRWADAGPSRRRRKRRSRVTRTRANSGQAAKRPVAATPGASLPLDASVLSIVANLEGLDLNGLRRQWRAHLAGEAPAHLPRWLLMRVLAYRLQSDAFGDLDKSIRRILRSGREDGVGAPFDRRAPQTRDGGGLKVGALLVREWKGKLERVMILEEGFAWNGQTFGSLSQIAKAMTGTNWNGHRFFGLRQGRTLAADAGADHRKSRKRTGPCRTTGASAGDASS
jgi:hypothetical protein